MKKILKKSIIINAYDKIKKNFILNDSVVRFKIGKSGVSKTETFKQHNYSSDYDNIFIILSSIHNYTINDLEKTMISIFKPHKKCKNDQVGGSDLVKSKTYILYVVYKLKSTRR